MVALVEGLVAGIVIFAFLATARLYFSDPHRVLHGIRNVEEVVVERFYETQRKNLAADGLISLAIAGVVFYFRIQTRVRRRIDPGAQKLFDTLAASLPGMVYQCRSDPNGRTVVTYTNDAIRWIYEMEPEEAQRDASPILDRVHPGDRERIWRSLVDSAKNLTPWRGEFRVVLPKQGERWRFAQAQVERLADGSTLWHGFIADVSWRKEAETALRKTEEIFRITFENSPIPMFLASIDRRIVRSNAAMLRFLGHPAPGIDGRRLQEIFGEIPALTSLEQTREASFERSFHGPDGSTSWGLVNLSMTEAHEGGRIIGQIVDITRRKQTELALLASEERLTLATSAGRVGTWEFDIPQRLLVWNDVMYDLYRVDRENFLPSTDNYWLFIHPEDRDRLLRGFRRALRRGRPFSDEFRIVRRDGSIRQIRADAIVVTDGQGRPLRAIGTNVDITEQKNAAADLAAARDAAEAADRAKGDFLAMMSHEIRTPLNAVLGFASLLESTSLDPVQKAHVETIHTSAEALLRLINDILDLSKIATEPFTFHPETFPLDDFVHGIRALIAPLARAKKIAFAIDVDPDTPPLVHTDRVRLTQILTNILGNAVKFTDSGSVSLDIRAEPTDDPLIRRWRFTMRDSGSGIPEPALKRIFEPFFQADSSSRRRHGGSGLGLAISERLARLLGGTITVESSPGLGSKFEFLLPLANARAIEEAPSLTGEIRAAPDKSVLVVEDNAVNAKLCAHLLGSIGCQSEFATTGREAVEKFRAGRFDLILMDIQLPELDGYEATREIRLIEAQRNLPATPVIALTANAMIEDETRCLAAGMNAYISKPIRMAQFQKLVTEWITSRPSTQPKADSSERR